MNIVLFAMRPAVAMPSRFFWSSYTMARMEDYVIFTPRDVVPLWGLSL